jgi:hypothetical protein
LASGKIWPQIFADKRGFDPRLSAKICGLNPYLHPAPG